ncbi:MAG: hypothetical protein M0P58_08875 [Bacteroidales bacterium]|nr:hypothetical protein [Bacteroidales bacterium]
MEKLTKTDIVNGPFPLTNLLNNSLYYPACGFDGNIIRRYSKKIQSFIFCDYATGEDAFMCHLHDFPGYDVFGNRSLKQDELIPNGWQMQIPPHFNIEEYEKYKDILKKPFAHWAVYERLATFDDNHGPKRFSLIYIGGEGVATYQALYWSNKKTAKVLAIIQPGTGFGFNWTDFRSKEGPLAWVVLNNKYGTPDAIIYGGMSGYPGQNEGCYEDFTWEQYRKTETIMPYRTQTDKVTIWVKK